MFIVITVLINVAAIAIWSAISGQNGFAEAAKMLRGEPAFIRIIKPPRVTTPDTTGQDSANADRGNQDFNPGRTQDNFRDFR